MIKFLSGECDLPIGMILIPYKSIGTKSDFLLGFKPDYVVLKENKEEAIKNVVIGVCEQSLSGNHCYSGIFGLDILKEVESFEYS